TAGGQPGASASRAWAAASFACGRPSARDWLRRVGRASCRGHTRRTLHRAPYHLHTEMTDYERTPRVLVVEDDDAIAQVLQRSLRMEGYEVKVAGDGVSALDLAHAYLPDLVMLDLGLPRLDGVDVARTLRETDDVPILVLTARDAV